MLKMLFKWRYFILSVAILISCKSYGWQQQDAVARQRALEDQQFQTAANKWMKVPFDLRGQVDTVSPGDRQARDAYWDKLIGSATRLSESGPHGHPMPIGFPDPSAPELGDLGDGVMVIGTFETYHSVLSASQRSVYTEIGLRILHVFGHPNAPIREGQLIDLDRPGGTIIAPWGETLSYEVHPKQMDLQPAHTYLIGLGYDPSGHSYRTGYEAGKLWDLTDGTVKPGNSLQKTRAEQGISEISGLSVTALIELMDKKFQDYYETRR